MSQKLPHPVSLAEAAAAIIKQGLESGRWSQLPGERKLAAELEISRSTARKALGLLTREGVLIAPNHGKSRALVSEPQLTSPRRGLRIAILTNQQFQSYRFSTQRFLMELEHSLESVGHELIRGLPDLTKQTRCSGGLAAIVAENQPDVWLVNMGTWEQLEFFSQCPQPTLAIGGRCLGLDVASIGFDYDPGIRAAVREFAARGHRRIVFLCERFIREAPVPGRMITAFREELEMAGITPSPFHFPDWDDSPEGLQSCLTELFRITPPTAILVSTPTAGMGLLGFCNARRIRIPHDLSLVIAGDNDDITWFSPRPALIRNETARIVPMILRWIEKCARGMPSRRQVLLPAAFEKGESIGPVAMGSR